MPSRRHFIRTAATVPWLLLAGCQGGTAPKSTKSNQSEKKLVNKNWIMPDEGEPHLRTWMSFGASSKVWGRELLKEVRRNLAKVAQTISEFEPVVMCVRPEEKKLAARHFDSLENIKFVECPLNDLWIRDYGAVYVVNEAGEKSAVDFNFNGWGQKQDYQSDAKVAALMAKESKVPRIRSSLCLEGGGIEVDGKGTAIITKSCVLNENRNPGLTKESCEKELRRVLGIEKVIWLPGVKGADITDGHTDFYARFTSPGVVVAHLDTDKSSPEYELTLKQIEILEDSADTKGEKLKVIPLEVPSTVRPRFESDDFCAGYINFYVCNDAVIAPEFGDRKTDGAAKEKLKECFPNREIVMLNIDGIAAGGGGIHCATQQEPKV